MRLTKEQAIESAKQNKITTQNIKNLNAKQIQSLIGALLDRVLSVTERVKYFNNMSNYSNKKIADDINELVIRDIQKGNY